MDGYNAVSNNSIPISIFLPPLTNFQWLHWIHLQLRYHLAYRTNLPAETSIWQYMFIYFVDNKLLSVKMGSFFWACHTLRLLLKSHSFISAEVILFTDSRLYAFKRPSSGTHFTLYWTLLNYISKVRANIGLLGSNMVKPSTE